MRIIIAEFEQAYRDNKRYNWKSLKHLRATIHMSDKNAEQVREHVKIEAQVPEELDMQRLDKVAAILFDQFSRHIIQYHTTVQCAT